MTLELLPNVSALKGKEEERKGRGTTTTNVDPTREVGGGGQTDLPNLEEQLRARGVNANPADLLAKSSIDGIRGAIAWWDSQQGAGPGVLVDVIRRGGRPGWRPRTSSLQREEEYGRSVKAWIARTFPEFIDDHGSVHPAAFSAVLRLHFQHGKGSLRKSEHGAMIREAVRRFNVEVYGA